MKGSQQRKNLDYENAAQIIDFIFTMRSAGIYLLEVEVGKLNYSNLPQGSILFTLHIGNSSYI